MGYHRFDPETKAQALAILDANGCNFREASTQTGLPIKTLRGWWRQRQRRAMEADSEADALSDLRQELIENALILAKALKEVDGSVTFHQRANALNQIIDKIIRLGAKPDENDENEQVIRFEYEDPEDNPLYHAARGTEDDYQE